MFIPRVEVIQGAHGECVTKYHNPAYPVIPRVQPVDLQVMWTRIVVTRPAKGPVWD